MNYTNNVPAHRKHANIQCNCRQCKQFDYADTTVLALLGQPSGSAAVELMRAIDSETWEHHYHYMPVSRRTRSYNKYQR